LNESAFETSLTDYANFMYLEHPIGLELQINKKTYQPKNPYD